MICQGYNLGYHDISYCETFPVLSPGPELEYSAYTPPPDPDSSFMSATTAISGALEELHSNSYLPADEWSHTLDSFLSSLQTDTSSSNLSCQDAIPEFLINECKEEQLLTPTFESKNGIDEFNKYLSQCESSPMSISPRISDMDHSFKDFTDSHQHLDQSSDYSNDIFEQKFELWSKIPQDSNVMNIDMEGKPSKENLSRSLVNHNALPNAEKNRQLFLGTESKADILEANIPRVCRWVDCNNTFPNRDAMSRHIERSHIDQRKGDDFTCFWAACPRRYRPFNARYKLLIHMRVHSGEKPNKCTFKGCTKAFSRLENLKIHMRSHTGERPYICIYPRCGKAFSNSSDRAKHQRTHINAKPYTCTVPGCKKSYTDPSSLRKHVKNHSAKEQALAKKKMSEVGNYRTLPFYSSSENLESHSFEKTIIKSENDNDRMFSNISTRRCQIQSYVPRAVPEAVAGGCSTNIGTRSNTGGFRYMDQHMSSLLTNSTDCSPITEASSQPSCNIHSCNFQNNNIYTGNNQCNNNLYQREQVPFCDIGNTMSSNFSSPSPASLSCFSPPITPVNNILSKELSHDSNIDCLQSRF